jgi:ketosteroid isomerase-like protein
MTEPVANREIVAQPRDDMSDFEEMSTRELGRRLIDEFGRGWSRGKVDLIMGVFSAEPTFQESPFSTPVKGTKAVSGYWVDVPLNQAEITFTSGEIFAAGPWFSTEFKCTFRRRRTGEWVDTRGALFCETENGRISEMRMYWHRVPA